MRIAHGQRVIIYAILSQFGLFGVLFVGGAFLPEALMGAVFGLGVLLAVVLSIYGTFALSKALYGTGAAVGLLLLSFVLGFLLLLYLSAQANKRFKEAGIRVGLLGVPASEFA